MLTQEKKTTKNLENVGMDGGNHGNTKVQGHFRMSETAYGSV